MEINFLAFGASFILDDLYYIAGLSDLCQLRSIGKFDSGRDFIDMI